MSEASVRGASWVHRKFETHLVELGAAATIPKYRIESEPARGGKMRIQWKGAHH